MSDYDRVFGKRTNTPSCRIVVRLDKDHGRLQRFAVQLQEQQTRGRWKTIAQMDHAPTDPNGHDIYAEGLHIDVYHADGSTTKLWPQHNILSDYPGAVVRRVTDYLDEHIPLLRRMAAGDVDADDPPPL